MLHSRFFTFLRSFSAYDPIAKPPEMRTLPQYRDSSIGVCSYGDLEIIFRNSGAKLSIGSFCSIAKSVKILRGGEHRLDRVATYPFMRFFDEARHFTGHPRTKSDIRISNDVWIGLGAVLMSAISIGDGAVVAAASTVVKDLLAYAIAGGSPAASLKHRFTQEQIAELHIRWCDWPRAKISRALPQLLVDEIEQFLQIARSGAFDRGGH